MTRAELEAAVDAYLDALAANDPGRLDAAPGLVFVENYQRLPLGEGSWRTVTGLGAYRHHFADPETGQAGAICTVRENGSPALLDLRLRIEGGRIAEAESFIIRDALAGVRYETERPEPEPVWLEAVPPGERLDREALIATVDRYFQSMQRNDGLGDYSFFDRECERIEHALQTTNVKKPMAYGHSHDTDFASMTAEAQWKTGFLGFVTEIRDRRFVVVDVERQVVFAFASFDHNGTVRVLHQTTGKDFVVPPYFDVPRTLQVMEAFKVRRGKLYRIEMTLTELPYGIRPPWGARAAAAPARVAGTPASRAGLEALLDEVLAAMKARDASGLPLAKGARYTEDGQVLAIGDGLWGTLGAHAGDGGEAPVYRIVLADPDRGEAAVVCGILEETTPGVLALRIRAAGGKIAEIEAVAIRLEEMGERGGTVSLFQPRLITEFDPAGFDAAAQAFLGPAAPAARDAIQGAVERWFHAVETGSAADLPLAADAERRENGHAASHDSDAPPLDPDVPAFRPFALGLAEQIDAGVFGRISRVRERRHLVDADQGLALSLAVFDNPGTLKAIDVAGAGEVRLPGLRARPPGAEINSTPEEDATQAFGARLLPNVLVPTSELVVQLTRVTDGRISRIESLARGGPYGMTAGWPP